MALGLRCSAGSSAVVAGGAGSGGGCGGGGMAILWQQCRGFSLQWLLLLHPMGSGFTGFCCCSAQALEHRFSNCGAWA